MLSRPSEILREKQQCVNDLWVSSSPRCSLIHFPLNKCKSSNILYPGLLCQRPLRAALVIEEQCKEGIWLLCFLCILCYYLHLVVVSHIPLFWFCIEVFEEALLVFLDILGQILFLISERCFVSSDAQLNCISSACSQLYAADTSTFTKTREILSHTLTQKYRSIISKEKLNCQESVGFHKPGTGK